MRQTDSFGNFNRDIRRYPDFTRPIVILMANDLRRALQAVSDPDRHFLETEGYINNIVQGYRDLVRITRLYR